MGGKRSVVATIGLLTAASLLSLLCNGLRLACAGAEPIYTALNPRGEMPEIKRIPLAPRPPDLNDKTVYIIHSWPQSVTSGFEKIATELKEALARKFPKAKIVVKHKESAYMEDEPKLWEEVKQSADAFVYVPADSAATTMWSVIWSSGLEKNGTPGIVLHFETFENNAKATCRKMGASLRLVSIPYPATQLGSEKTAKIMGDILTSMTVPLTGSEKETGTIPAEKVPRVAIEADYSKIQEYFLAQKWTDGLPIIPPTPDSVTAMLKGTSRPPDKVVATNMPPEGWRVTVEKVAINAVMAGCRPEYMPVLLAVVEAFCKGNYSSAVRSTNSFAFMQLVNGPIARQIAMNSGTYALGPGNQANATIGRALRLFIYNLGGGQNEVNLMGTHGNVGSYSFCFAENEEASPWEPFHVSQGYRKEESTVTIFSGGWSHTGNMLHQDIKRLARDVAMFQYPSGLVALLSPAAAEDLSRKGLKKKDAEELLWSSATLTMQQFKNDHYYHRFIVPVLKGREMGGKKYRWPAHYLDLPDDAVVQVYPRDGVHIVVVGGDANAMMQGWHMWYPSIAPVDKWR